MVTWDSALTSGSSQSGQETSTGVDHKNKGSESKDEVFTGHNESTKETFMSGEMSVEASFRRSVILTEP